MEQPPPSKQPQPSASSSTTIRFNAPRAGPSPSFVPQMRPGTVIQARVMSGEYEAARLIGRFPEKIVGDYVVVVSYLEGGDGMEEEVPISMIRTLDNAEVRLW